MANITTPTGPAAARSASVPRYSTAMIRLHWLTFLLVVLAYVFMEFREIFERGSAGREFMKAAHYSVGLTILALTIARLVLKFTGAPAPAITPPPAPWQHTAAQFGHALLYAFLLVMPVIGWAALSADNHPAIFYGFNLPALLSPDKILSGQLEEVHETIGNIGYFLIGGHAILAIIHHKVFRDTTLIRMMPPKSV